MKKKILTYCRGRCIYTASRARHICMLRDNWPVIDWREPIGLQERLEGRSSHNGVISVMSRDSLKGNHCLNVALLMTSPPARAPSVSVESSEVIGLQYFSYLKPHFTKYATIYEVVSA